MLINVPRIHQKELLFTYLMKLSEANILDFDPASSGSSYGEYLASSLKFMESVGFDADSVSMMLREHTASNILNLIKPRTENSYSGMWTDYYIAGCPDCIIEMRSDSVDDIVLTAHNLPAVSICYRHNTALRSMRTGLKSSFEVVLEETPIKNSSVFKRQEYALFMKSLLEEYPSDRNPDASNTIHAVRSSIMDLGYYPDQMLYGGEYHDMSPLLFAMLWNRILKEDFPETVMRNLYYALCDLIDENSNLHFHFIEEYFMVLYSLFKTADRFYEFCFTDDYADAQDLITFGKYVGHASAITERKLQSFVQDEKNGSLQS